MWAGKPGCFWSRLTATISNLIGARFCSFSRMSSRPKLSLPPETQTITRSPSSIMLKSMMAWPTWRHRRFSSLWVSRSIFGSRAAGALAVAAAKACRSDFSLTSWLVTRPCGLKSSACVSLSVQTAFIVLFLLPLSGFHANRHFTVVKNLQLGNLHAHAQNAGQLHQAIRQLANQGLKQVDVLGG